jgi:hypothetical protein
MVPHSNYKYGYEREDGYKFSGWKRRNGNVTPNFRSPKSFKQQDEAAKIRKQIKYRTHKGIENKILKIIQKFLTGTIQILL